jgi:transposase
MEKKAVLDSRRKLDGVAYNSTKKANRLRHKTARQSTMGLYLFVVIWCSRATNRSQFFLGIYSFRSVCFEKFLELFASEYPEDLHLIQVDNVGFHNSLNLSIPENVILLFQPAYSPEVNPRERLWGYVKEQLKWLRFERIEELRAAVQKELKKLTKEVIASLTGWEFILAAISVA